ncbi:hypothetical protein PHISP_07362 [Aspergillus sp. HF37]|nr:hypothetical protein PHISP_07362 [Aspergillus sp. HF37]
MKAYWWIWASFLAPTVLSDSLEASPFQRPQNAETTKRAFEVLQILKRADTCPAGYSPCTKMGSSKVCCKDGTTCTQDAAHNIACCPTGASCTGQLTGPSTGSDSFMFPQTASATTTTGQFSATATRPTITDAPYPFVIIPTSFANAESCSSWYSVCQSQYSGCREDLGGQYGVTVAGPNGAGVTVQGSSAAASPTASVCSSLSFEACHGLQMPHCVTYSQWNSNANFALPRRTSAQDMLVGLAVAVAGMFI